MAGKPTSEGFVPVGRNVNWHHPEGWQGMSVFPRVKRSEFTPVISCRDHGYGATAISVGEADFVRSRVVQAISMYCGNAPKKRPDDCADMVGSDNGADRLLKDEQRPYNCHYYSKTFILGARPTPVPTVNAFLEPQELQRLGYALVSEAPNVNQLSGARAGDILLVRGPSYYDIFQRPGPEFSVHSAIVTATDQAGRIQLTRQKPDDTRCVTDMTPDQVFREYQRPGAKYQVWRAAGKKPRAPGR